MDWTRAYGLGACGGVALVAEAEAGKIGGSGGPVAAGCDGGALTVRGAGLAAVLAIGAVALAVMAPRPHRSLPAAANG